MRNIGKLQFHCLSRQGNVQSFNKPVTLSDLSVRYSLWILYLSCLSDSVPDCMRTHNFVKTCETWKRLGYTRLDCLFMTNQWWWMLVPPILHVTAAYACREAAMLCMQARVLHHWLLSDYLFICILASEVCNNDASHRMVAVRLCQPFIVTVL